VHDDAGVEESAGERDGDHDDATAIDDPPLSSI